MIAPGRSLRSASLTASLGTLLACHPEQVGGPDGAGPLYDDPPSITLIQWSCSTEDETWTFQVETANWTANGRLYLTTDAAYLEEHALTSRTAAADGSSDSLEVELGIEADWRDVSSGSTTAFLCTPTTETTLSFLVVVYTPGTGAEADCRTGGGDPTLFATIEDVPECDEVWAQADTGTVP